MNTMSWRILEKEDQKSCVITIFCGAFIVQLPDGRWLFYAQFKSHVTQAYEVRLLWKSFIQVFGKGKDAVC